MLNSPIIGFYSGTEPDNRGRHLHEIQQWPDEQLETVHDYIQWLFPLPERSGFNVSAPVLNPESIQGFRTRADLQAMTTENGLAKEFATKQRATQGQFSAMTSSGRLTTTERYLPSNRVLAHTRLFCMTNGFTSSGDRASTSVSTKNSPTKSGRDWLYARQTRITCDKLLCSSLASKAHSRPS